MEFWKHLNLPFSQWDGEIDRNKILIIVAEAGIGDEFISVRFMSHIKNFGMRCIWLTNRKDICDIFNRNGYESITNIKQLESNLSLEKLVWAYSMDLPIILNSEYKDLWEGPYLKADEKLVQQYGELINSPKLKIGLRWQGNPGYDQDLHRSIPLKEMYDALKHLDAEFYSLQKDDGLEELEGLPITDLSDKLTDFDQTLAIIQNLDLVVSSCTSVVHAAASMGKPVVVISPISSYYVWCHTLEKSPWYGDHVTILRQQKPRVWGEPLAQLKEFVDANYYNR